VRDALDSVADIVGTEDVSRYQQLFDRVLGR
jgi:hypothetical protein